jgi:hypothetical protein
MSDEPAGLYRKNKVFRGLAVPILINCRLRQMIKRVVDLRIKDSIPMVIDPTRSSNIQDSSWFTILLFVTFIICLP